jgi:hypothetical protein
MQINRKRKDRLAHKSQSEQAEQRVEHQGQCEFGSDGFWRLFFSQATRTAAAQEQRQEETAKDSSHRRG